MHDEELVTIWKVDHSRQGIWPTQLSEADARKELAAGAFSSREQAEASVREYYSVRQEVEAQNEAAHRSYDQARSQGLNN